MPVLCCLFDASRAAHRRAPQTEAWGGPTGPEPTSAPARDEASPAEQSAGWSQQAGSSPLPAPQVQPRARGFYSPKPQSQSLNRSYGSILPTSLALILAFAIVFETLTPDADSGTITNELKPIVTFLSSTFQGAYEALQTAQKNAQLFRMAALNLCFMQFLRPGRRRLPARTNKCTDPLTRKENSPRSLARRRRVRFASPLPLAGQTAQPKPHRPKNPPGRRLW